MAKVKIDPVWLVVMFRSGRSLWVSYEREDAMGTIETVADMKNAGNKNALIYYRDGNDYSWMAEVSAIEAMSIDEYEEDAPEEPDYSASND